MCAGALPPTGTLPECVDRRYEVRAAYSEGAGIYRIVPWGVAFPRNRAELQELVVWAGASSTPLVARGAGSGMGGGNVGRGLVVDLTHGFAKPLEIRGGRATVGAGATFRALADRATPTDQRLPPEPSSSRFCTLGGMIACNAAGARSLRYGSVRTWVESLEVVWADGSAGAVRRGEHGRWPTEGALRALVEEKAALVRERFPKTTKNSSGYALDRYLDTGDLVDILVGSEGTLALVTECTLRLAPIVSHRASVLVAVRQLDDIAPAVSALLTERPTALELLERTFLDLSPSAPSLVPYDAQAALIAEFEEPSAGGIGAVVERVQRAMITLGAHAEIGVTLEDQAALWALRHDASPALARLPESRRSLQIIEDGCVPIAALGPYVAGVRSAAARNGVEVVLFGHAGDGHLHVNALVDLTLPDWQDRIRRLFEDVTALIARLGGTLAGEHGDGRLRAHALPVTFGPEVAHLFAQVKRLFDPNHILNPGVIVSDGRDYLSQLKVGSQTATIPEDVAHRLRSIEREGRWEVSKRELASASG